MEENDRKLPLCVDLDGTLIRVDLLYESTLSLLKRNPLYAFRLPFWLLRGRGILKNEIAERTDLRADNLPYNRELLDHLREQKDAKEEDRVEEKGQGRRAMDRVVAQRATTPWFRDCGEFFTRVSVHGEVG